MMSCLNCAANKELRIERIKGQLLLCCSTGSLSSAHNMTVASFAMELEPKIKDILIHRVAFACLLWLCGQSDAA